MTGTNRVIIPIPEKPPLKFEFDVTPFAVTGNEPLAVLGRTEGQIELWNLKEHKLTALWSAGTNWISTVALSSDGTKLATGDEKGFLKVWNMATHTELSTCRPTKEFAGATKLLRQTADRSSRDHILPRKPLYGTSKPANASSQSRCRRIRLSSHQMANLLSRAV